MTAAAVHQIGQPVTPDDVSDPPQHAEAVYDGAPHAVVSHRYPRDLERDVFSDGEYVCHLRPICAEDAQKLIEFHLHLAPRSVYLRFFTFHPTLSEAEVRRFTCVDYVNRLALVAERDNRLIAVGRFDSKPGDTEAEVAFVVADEFQHHGLGALLLDELAKVAKPRGILTFRAETLCENHTMLDVFRHAGFPLTTSIEYGTVTLRFPIEPTLKYQEALAQRERIRPGPTDDAAATMTATEID
jgi:GNAT superfamily N-acetyltransferase